MSVREFAPPYKASDTEAADQFYEPDSENQRFSEWVRSRRSRNKKRQTPLVECLSLFVGDPYGNRTHVSALRGPRLSRLTNGPFVGCPIIILPLYPFVK